MDNKKIAEMLLKVQMDDLKDADMLVDYAGIIEAEGTVGGPLLLEVIRRCQQKEKALTSGEVSTVLSFAICSCFQSLRIQGGRAG